jgi:SAM-dependent methyltransferase
MAYGGRPGISPALAPLLATGAIRKNHLILDVGCGTGNDCILLARWGFRRVVGIHADPQAVRIARGRATRARLGKRVRFLVGGPGDLPPDVTPARVNIVLDTLVGNNLEAGFDAHYRAIWRAMKPTGFLIECDRTD